MIPKQSYQHSSHSPVYLKQNQSSQMQSPGSKQLHINKQNLLDQIISNCQKAESPLPFSPRKSGVLFGKVSKCEEKDKDKENFRTKMNGNGLGFGCNNFMSGGRISESKERRDSRIQINQGTNEYFTNSEHKHSPLYTKEPIRQRQHNPSLSFKKHAEPLINCGQQNNGRGMNQNKIQSIRESHVEHCRREERKIRLYYVELENKLCEMRNKELKMLAEYEASKLREFDELIKNGCSEFLEIEKIEKGEKMVRVDEGVKAEIQGCLWNGMSEVCFSFDQKCN